MGLMAGSESPLRTVRKCQPLSKLPDTLNSEVLSELLPLFVKPVKAPFGGRQNPGGHGS